MDEDFFCSSEFSGKKSGIQLLNTKKTSHKIGDIEMDRVDYFKKLSSVVLDKNSSYTNQVQVINVEDREQTLDIRKFHNRNEKNCEINNSKINFAYQSNDSSA
jgi:hypothetical protein